MSDKTSMQMNISKSKKRAITNCKRQAYTFKKSRIFTKEYVTALVHT